MVQQSFRLIGMFYYVDWWNAQHFPDKSTWVGVGEWGWDWLTYPWICLSKIWIIQPFPIKNQLIQSLEKSTSFYSRPTNLLLWIQWISLESLLNVYLHVVFYMHMHPCVVSTNDDKPLCNYCTWTVCSSGWVLLSCSRFYYSLHCTHVPNCTFRFLKLHSKKHSALCKSRVGLWSARTAHCLRVASVCGQPEQRTV